MDALVLRFFFINLQVINFKFYENNSKVWEISFKWYLILWFFFLFLFVSEL